MAKKQNIIQSEDVVLVPAKPAPKPAEGELLIKVIAIKDINHCVNDRKIVAQKGTYLSISKTEMIRLKELVECL